MQFLQRNSVDFRDRHSISIQYTIASDVVKRTIYKKYSAQTLSYSCAVLMHFMSTVHFTTLDAIEDSQLKCCGGDGNIRLNGDLMVM